MSSAIQTIEEAIWSVEDTFNQVLSDKSMNFKRESEFAIQQVLKSKFSLEIASKFPQSVRDAVTNVAAIGLSLNPAKKQAYLVPRKTGIVLEVSYLGLVELAVGSGSIRWAKAEVVRAKDGFVLNGYDKPPTHNFEPFATDRGEVVGVYCVAKTADGDYLTGTMTADEVHDIRDRSESWKKDQSGPWKTDYTEMVKKTIVKRDSKLWPKTDRLDKAIHYLNTDGGQGIEFEQVAGNPGVQDAKTTREEWIGKAALAKSIEEMTKISKAGAKAFNEAKDRDGYKAFAEAVQKRGAELRATKGEVIDV